MKKVYLAGQPKLYDSWKEDIKKIEGFSFYDWEIDSNQTSPDTFFPDDLKAVYSADILIANPGIAPSKSTWIEIGYFLAKNTTNPGDTCNNLIIIWKEERSPKWSIEFVKKAGHIVKTVEEAIYLLNTLK